MRLLDDIDRGASLLHDLEQLVKALPTGDSLQIEGLVEVPVVQVEVLFGLSHVQG